MAAVTLNNFSTSPLLGQLQTGGSGLQSLAGLAMVSPNASDTQGYLPALPLPGKGKPGFSIGGVFNWAKSQINSVGNGTALLFHIEGENKINLRCDVTDHYVEDNSSIQDHVGLPPETVRVVGYIGELNNVLPQAFQIATAANNLLGSVGAFSPKMSQAANVAINKAASGYTNTLGAVKSSIGAVSSIAQNVFDSSEELGGAGSGVFSVGSQFAQNKQQQMFQSFYAYRANRTLFTIQTPWAVFTNMIILDLEAIQDETTKMITTFNVTFKKMRFAQDATVQVSVQSGKSAAQTSPTVDAGTQTGATAAVTQEAATTQAEAS